ncbi:MAG: hypothetical protein U1E89_13395 [Burkholderiaceae bacterium]
MRPETNRFVLRASWVIAAALWAAALWMWFDIREATRPQPPASPPLAAGASDTAEVAETKPEPVFARERPRPGPPPAEAARPARAVCGLEPPPGRAPTDAEIQAFVEQQGGLGHDRAVAALERRNDAASLMLRALLEVVHGLRAEPLACEGGADCSARLGAAVIDAYQRAPQAIDALLLQAQGSSEPLLVQTALLVCDAQRGAPKGCAGLSPRRLTQIDADNAAAWLELAAREGAAADEALYRASLASRWDSRWGQAIVQADEALPAELSPLQRFAVIHDVTTALHAYGQGAVFVAARLCGDAAVRDANRAQVCERLARTMVERGHDMLEVGVGLGIARRLPALNEALQAARERHRARTEVLAAQAAFEPAAPCDTLRQQLQAVRDMQRGGEVAYAQRAVERSGVGVAELARRAEARAATGAAAASAVATAPPATR